MSWALLGRETATHELAALHVPPVVVRTVSCCGVFGTTAAGLAAAAQMLVERARAQVVDLADGGANLRDALTRPPRLRGEGGLGFGA